MKWNGIVVRWLQKVRSSDKAARASRQRRRAPLCLEALESRVVPTVYLVNTTQDVLGDTTAGEVTLRDALTAIVNQAPSGQAPAGSPGSNEIDFAIGAAGSVQTINLGSALPTISNATTPFSVFIHGSSQGGSGYQGPPLIVLNGAVSGIGADGLRFAAGSDGSEVQGLVFQQFQTGNGIVINGASGIQIVGNYIGTDVTAGAPGSNGVFITGGASWNTVGGTTSGSANVISGNGTGVLLYGSGTSNNVVLGNLIGTDKSGTVRLGNSFAGVRTLGGASGNTVGGTSSGSGNVISGNHYGVYLTTSGNVVLGNLIGTDITGTAGLGNDDGVIIEGGVSGNTVGGTSSGSANVISGNTNGVVLYGSFTSNNVVLGNKIGTDITGTASLGNRLTGVLIAFGASGNTVGGTSSGSANVISSNTNGVYLRNSFTSNNVVLGNLIGTDITGTARLGNINNGVVIDFGATGNTVGGTTSGSGNVISSVKFTGVFLYGSGTRGNVVLGNRIGTDITGTANFGNPLAGVLIAHGATGNTIGGTAASSGNLIAFNGKGVVVTDASTTGNRILGNSISSNSGPGIDLGDDGPTGNGANPRSFPNNGQNTPVITSVSGTTVTGTLTSTPSTTFRLEFYASPASGSAFQGATFLGSLDVTTDPSGHVSFTASVSAIPANSVVTATATNLSTGDTSEFGILTNAVPTASISGVVFVDVNQNGLFDANEPGLDGVTIELRDDSGNLLETTTTGSGGFYLFADLNPGTYRLHEIQPSGVTDGAQHLGSLGGTVLGNDLMQLTLNGTDATDYAFAELGQQVTHGDAAGSGFWQNKQGQALITQGGTALAGWLTTNFGNVFGDTFVGKDGAYVAAFFKNQLFKQAGGGGSAKVDAQFMAVALATYFTDSNLAGNVAVSYGFNVTDTGTGARVVNVGSAGSAFEVSNGTTLTVMQLLQATNARTDQNNVQTGFVTTYDVNGDGVVDSAEANLRSLANALYSSINNAGGI